MSRTGTVALSLCTMMVCLVGAGPALAGGVGCIASPPPPVCAANPTVTVPFGTTSTPVSFPPPSFDPNDYCPNPVATCSPPTGSSFPPGVTLVTCTVTDDFADSATCQLQVTVNVAAAPTIAVPAVSRWGLLALVGALALAGVGSLVWKR